MSATITWNISVLNCSTTDPQPDTVITAHWQCNGVQTEGDKTYNGSVYASTSFTLNPDEPFTPYADLTQEQVLGWIWASGVDKDATEAAVQQQINAQINPPVISPPLPWATQPQPQNPDA